MSLAATLKTRARQLKAEVTALYYAARDPRTPWYAKAFIAAIVAYALSPIDLIPDFIPVLGYADDAILVSLVLRSVVRHAGLDTVRRHGSGSDDGLAAVQRLTGLSG